MLAGLLALALQQPAQPAQAGAVVIDRILAVVSTQPIMLTDVSAAIEFHLLDVPPGTADPTAYVLDRMIRRTLILTEVDRFQPPAPDEAEITRRIDDMERRAGSPEAFERALAVTGTTRAQLHRFIRDDLRIRTYVLQRFGADRPETEVNAKVDAWVADMRRRTEISVLYQGK
jgi:hypothetical protein